MQSAFTRRLPFSCGHGHQPALSTSIGASEEGLLLLGLAFLSGSPSVTVLSFLLAPHYISQLTFRSRIRFQLLTPVFAQVFLFCVLVIQSPPTLAYP